MTKSFCPIKAIVFLCLFSMSSLGYANSIVNQEADAIFTQIERGDAIYDYQVYRDYLSQLDNLITKADIERQMRLSRARCWSFDIYEQGQLTKALSFVKHALTNPELANYPNHKLGLQLCQTWYTERTGDVETALKGYNKLLKKAYALEDLRLIADIRGMRGYLYSFQGNFTQALEDLITAKSLYKNLKLSIYVEINLYEIAKAYRRFGDQKSAIRYFKQLEELKKKSKNYNAATTMVVSMAIAEEELGNLERAKELFEKGYAYWQSKGDDLLRSGVGVNMAGTLIKLNEIESAKKYLTLAVPYIQSSDEGFYSYMQLFFAQVYLAENKLEQAHESLALARTAFERNKNTSALAQVQQVESQVYLNQGNWQQAYLAQSEYIKLHLKLDDKLLSSYTTEMRTRFNTEQVEQENRHLIENQQLREIELAMLEQNKFQQWIIIVLGGLITIILSAFAYKQNQKNKLLSALALTDDLTQLPNRRYIYNHADECLQAAKRCDMPLSVIAFDADNFKIVNDTYGHEVGDMALKLLAKTCRKTLAAEHISARVGGEEFLVILPNIDKPQAYKIACNLVQQVAEANFSSFPCGFSLTISAGVACLGDDGDELHTILKSADEALYSAKHEGRNQARMAN
ncbi:tetratricopeptide repeat-containing diguanylate cyclase [Shewanella sairae]|nr:tetratricopeptide repeat-containing diguanylate cyclase [Shewanella sairae]MCL1129719.1 diguanylate cyclase [Shewanella sairae]